MRRRAKMPTQSPSASVFHFSDAASARRTDTSVQSDRRCRAADSCTARHACRVRLRIDGSSLGSCRTSLRRRCGSGARTPREASLWSSVGGMASSIPTHGFWQRQRWRRRRNAPFSQPGGGSLSDHLPPQNLEAERCRAGRNPAGQRRAPRDRPVPDLRGLLS